MDIHGQNVGAAGDVEIGTQNNFFGVNPTAPPNSIPSVKGFVGREDYLKDLQTFYDGGTRCFVLHGTGGVGKSALALQFAGRIAKDFKAKIFVELQGLSEKPYSARDAMFEIVRQFNREISADLTEAQLKTIYIQYVQAQETLIVLDNAENKQSVEPLMQAKACFITTSRQSFILMGGESLAVKKMLPEDARKLLFEIAGEQRFDERADELAYLAGYLPMALKPLASILAEDELETAADLVARYRDKKALLDERVPDYNNLTVEASFELSYEKLSPEMQQNWRRLSVFPADFEAAAIASVLDITHEIARETQKHLRRYNLLELNSETKRFNLHDLARVFTDEKLSAEERFNAQFLHARFYASLLYLTNEIRAKDQENGFLNSLRIIDTEWSNITTGQKWAAGNVEKQDQIAELCCHYSVQELLTLRLHPRESIAWQTLAFEAAKKIDNKIFEGNLAQNLGNAHTNLGEYRKAIDYHEAALKIARDISHRQGEGQCLGNLGLAYFWLGESKKAIDYHEQHLAISLETGDRFAECNSLGNLGLVYSSLGEHRKAIEYYEQSLEISRETGNRSAESGSLGNLGNAYFSLGEYREGLKCHEHNLAISREIGDRFGEGNSLGNLGNVYYCLNEKEKACDLWRQSLAILEDMESPNADIFRQSIEKFCGE